MKLHSVFLRKECALPERLDPLTEPVGENWKLLEEIIAPALDTMIRRMGWRFMWLGRPCSRRGFALKEKDAAQRALTHALNVVARRFNAAELVSVHATKYLGLHIANVTLQPRQIQRFSWLDLVDDAEPLAVSAR